MGGYEINEKDIRGILKYLEVFHPENANHEFAEEMLRYLKAASRRLAFADPDALDELYESFVTSKRKD
ncbi:MAG: hypothetical protein JWO61_58 [Candidatus Saccharibacteria bacterium]|nr:hypothetical protein [Candidatus Saccharibacteria bacterium]